MYVCIIADRKIVRYFCASFSMHSSCPMQEFVFQWEKFPFRQGVFWNSHKTSDFSHKKKNGCPMGSETKIRWHATLLRKLLNYSTISKSKVSLLTIDVSSLGSPGFRKKRKDRNTKKKKKTERKREKGEDAAFYRNVIFSSLRAVTS